MVCDLTNAVPLRLPPPLRPVRRAGRQRVNAPPAIPPVMESTYEQQRRSLGVRLRLADVAAGLRVHRARPARLVGLAPRAVRLFLRPSRHAGKAGPGARPRPRRRLPRCRLPRRRGARARQPSPICASASRSPASTSKPMRQIISGRKSGAARACAGVLRRPRPRPICRPVELDTQLHLVRQGHGRSGPNRDYVLATVEALEALGCYDRDLHLLAARLRGTHEGHVRFVQDCGEQ